MIGHMFGSSSSQTEPFTALPRLPAAASTLSERYPPAENGVSPVIEPTVSSHSRKPSLRVRLKMGRGAAEQGSQRPTTPEIESWKQRLAEPRVDVASDQTERMLRANSDDAFRSKHSGSPVKIVRSKSLIRRKPPPEIKQEEIDISSSTPVYGKAFRTLKVDQHASSPFGGSPTSSPELVITTLPDPEPRADFEPTAARGLGLIDASAAASKGANSSVPSIDIRPGTPSREAWPDVASSPTNSASQLSRQRLAPGSPPHVPQRRRSSGMHSIADTSMSVDRPWSLISASEADTPLLKLRSLVVNTNVSEDSREENRSSDDLFFRRPTAEKIDVSHRPPVSDTEEEEDDDNNNNNNNNIIIKETEVLSEGGSQQLRSCSQATMLSDAKHDILSVLSSQSGSSTIRAAGDVQAQLGVSGLSATSGAPSNVSQTSTARACSVPPGVRQSVEPSFGVAVNADAKDRDGDTVGPLPAMSPSASQHCLPSRQHRRDGSVGSTYSQMTIQQARRSSTASRVTVRSSGHWSEGRLSEDALSALEAEVGQARRAEVIALGKGRVKDWVGGGGADRPLPTAEAPTLSRSNTLRKNIHQDTSQHVADRVDELESQRQKTLNEHLDRRLQQLSEAQLGKDTTMARMPFDTQARRPLDEILRDASPKKHQDDPAMKGSEIASQSAPGKGRSEAKGLARLSAFHDRKLVGHSERSQVALNSATEEAIRLGRAPSKRVRRNVSETQSSGEAVMVQRESAVTGEDSTAPSLLAARHPRRSTSLSRKKSASVVDQLNPTLDAALPFSAAVEWQNSAAQPAWLASQGKAVRNVQDDSKKHSNQRTYATSEEAVRAKQLERLERKKRLAEKEAKRQALLQQKYAHKKQSDPLLAARLALAGLEPREAAPRDKTDHTANKTLCTTTKLSTGTVGGGLQPPAIPERRGSSHSGGRLSVPRSPLVRKNSDSGSVTSFHTAVDAPVSGSAAVLGSPLSKAAVAAQPCANVGDVSCDSKWSGEVRPDTSYSIASSLAVDFEFPVPPQRMKEQLSDDGTLLSRAGLQQSPYQQWRERRHYGQASPFMQAPQRDSSLRDRSLLFLSKREEEQGMTASRTMPKLMTVSALDSVKQSVTLRKSRSVGYNSGDLRKLSREQMMWDVSHHASPVGMQGEVDSGGLAAQYGEARGLGIEMADDSSIAARYSNVGSQRYAIAA